MVRTASVEEVRAELKQYNADHPELFTLSWAGRGSRHVRWGLQLELYLSALLPAPLIGGR